MYSPASQLSIGTAFTLVKRVSTILTYRLTRIPTNDTWHVIDKNFENQRAPISRYSDTIETRLVLMYSPRPGLHNGTAFVTIKQLSDIIKPSPASSCIIRLLKSDCSCFLFGKSERYNSTICEFFCHVTGTIGMPDIRRLQQSKSCVCSGPRK